MIARSLTLKSEIVFFGGKGNLLRCKDNFMANQEWHVMNTVWWWVEVKKRENRLLQSLVYNPG
jgi:hypothetical protein